MHRLRTRATKVADVALRVLAGALLVSLFAAAWHDVSKAWDVWFYHLPFAARIAGIVDATTYAFGRANEDRFGGFPLFGEALQGLAWRVTGRPECANLVAFATLPALAWYLRRTFEVPLHLTVLGLLAIPLVQIHATACYVDLPANAGAATLILFAYAHVSRRETPSPRALAFAGAVAAATANTKFQLVPVVLAASLVVVVLALREKHGRAARLAVLAVALPLVMATPIKNLFVHENPVWPVELTIAGRSLPHVEKAYASSPDWLEGSTRPVRFAASVLEMGLRPIASHRRWSIDQWTPPREPGYRMGGFFGAYAVVVVASLVLAAVRQRSREARTAAAFALGTTAVVGVLPQSHELRYYLVWMLVMVALALAVWAKKAPLVAASVATTALAIVAWSTEAHYLYPSGDSFAALVEAKVDRGALARVPPGARVCIDRQPWTFLYAPRFHTGRRGAGAAGVTAGYSVQEAETPEDCKGAPTLEELAR